MQCVKRRKTGSRENARTVGCLLTRRHAEGCGVQPQLSRQATVFARIAFVFDVMCGRSHESQPAFLCSAQDCSHSLSFSPHSLCRAVIEGTLKATDVQIHE